MDNKNENFLLKVGKYFKKNGHKIVMITFFLAVIACFIYALGFSTNFYYATSSGELLVRSVSKINGGNFTNGLIEDNISTYASDYFDFFQPVMDYNRFFLCFATVLIIIVGIGFLLGNKRRKKYYVGNFVSSYLAVAVAIICCLVGITYITKTDDLWEKTSYDKLYINDQEYIVEVGYLETVDSEGKNAYSLVVLSEDEDTIEWTYFLLDNDTHLRYYVYELPENLKGAAPTKTIYDENIYLTDELDESLLGKKFEGDPVARKFAGISFSASYGVIHVVVLDDNGEVSLAPQYSNANVYYNEAGEQVASATGALTRKTYKWSTMLNTDTTFKGDNSGIFNFGYILYIFTIVMAVSNGAFVTVKLVKQIIADKNKKKGVMLNEQN